MRHYVANAHLYICALRPIYNTLIPSNSACAGLLPALVSSIAKYSHTTTTRTRKRLQQCFSPLHRQALVCNSADIAPMAVVHPPTRHSRFVGRLFREQAKDLEAIVTFPPRLVGWRVRFCHHTTLARATARRTPKVSPTLRWLWRTLLFPAASRIGLVPMTMLWMGPAVPKESLVGFHLFFRWNALKRAASLAPLTEKPARGYIMKREYCRRRKPSVFCCD